MASKSNKWNVVKSVSKIANQDIISKIKNYNSPKSESLIYCYNTLDKVSRSFAVVIKQLSPELRDAVCVFYLSLRALDTIEDDLSTNFEQRMQWLNEFYLHVGNENFKLENVGDTPDYVELLSNYPKVAKAFNELNDKYKTIIKDIAKEMGLGMAHFAKNEVKTIDDYNMYCHYVAGLVGIGLSKLFAASGIESKELLEKLNIANSMGLFLQKTNITRDYAEDVEQGRFFWPQEIWKKFGNSNSAFLHKSDLNALGCLNTMVNDALKHFIDCIDYLNSLKETSIFRFCAIPQVMALGTLKLVYNNAMVFSENIKMEKSESAIMFANCNSIEEFNLLVKNIIDNWKTEASMPLYFETNQILNNISKKLVLNN